MSRGILLPTCAVSSPCPQGAWTAGAHQKGDYACTCELVVRVVAVVFLFVSAAFAQDASLVGTVTDETKAAVPGPTITVTDLATGAASVVVTDERGDYRVPRLAPGKYKVQAELTGFATAR